MSTSPRPASSRTVFDVPPRCTVLPSATCIPPSIRASTPPPPEHTFWTSPRGGCCSQAPPAPPLPSITSCPKVTQGPPILPHCLGRPLKVDVARTGEREREREGDGEREGEREGERKRERGGGGGGEVSRVPEEGRAPRTPTSAPASLGLRVQGKRSVHTYVNTGHDRTYGPKLPRTKSITGSACQPRRALRGGISKSILQRPCQFLAINTHKMTPRTSKGLQERAWDAPTKGLLWLGRRVQGKRKEDTYVNTGYDRMYEKKSRAWGVGQ